ncbi:MAG: 4Fe-4S binding protein [Coriobacteriales bacterium]|nr:4Fe-4S binding protein [Coriobacteriales bacterium]MBQ6586419.1 4Fe-4S binding protein [Coriobacteriales bacterium]
MEGYGNHIVQYSPEYSLCAGCEACSIMCGLTHEGFTGPGNCRIRLKLARRSLIHEILSCQQCDDHPCYEACPLKDDAMCIDADTGIVYVNEDSCIGCGRCMKACKFTPSRISLRRSNVKRGTKAVKCDLCRGNPDGPQCIKYCQVVCIGLSDDSVLREDGWWPKSAAPQD